MHIYQNKCGQGISELRHNQTHKHGLKQVQEKHLELRRCKLCIQTNWRHGRGKTSI